MKERESEREREREREREKETERGSGIQGDREDGEACRQKGVLESMPASALGSGGRDRGAQKHIIVIMLYGIILYYGMWCYAMTCYGTVC